MSETINDKRIFSLLEVSTSIQKTLTDRYKTSFWVKAEMNKLNYYKHSGHCYPELVEKLDGKVVSQINSTMWSSDFNRINNSFIKLLNEPLKDGIKVLMLVKISYHATYGVTLSILDIDASFTLGDLQREKQETIKKLQTAGTYNKNKSLPFPLLPQRIAIISVETSKGYADFVGVISANPWKYHFFHMLFPSVLQGEKAVSGIISQLRKIQKVQSHFDAVAIIRGGGGDVGLSCYNNYDLAKEIASFPIPVLTGIGHATNETVAEMVSYSNAITPTKLAEYLIQKFHNYAVPVQKAREKITDHSQRLLRDQNTMFQSEVKFFRAVTDNLLIRNNNIIKSISKSLMGQTHFRFRNAREALLTFKTNIHKSVRNASISAAINLKQFEITLKKDVNSQLRQRLLVIKNIENNNTNMRPHNVLKRGYSITMLNGKALTDQAAAVPGDEITTILAKGKITSTVKSK